MCIAINLRYTRAATTKVAQEWHPDARLCGTERAMGQRQERRCFTQQLLVGSIRSRLRVRWKIRQEVHRTPVCFGGNVISMARCPSRNLPEHSRLRKNILTVFPVWSHVTYLTAGPTSSAHCQQHMPHVVGNLRARTIPRAIHRLFSCLGARRDPRQAQQSHHKIH